MIRKLQFNKRIVSTIMSLTMAVSVMTGIAFPYEVNAAEEMTLHNPRIVESSIMKSGQKVTWDCIWFGSYPQTEVKNNDKEYTALTKAGGWDKNGDAVINGTKYRRMLKSDATYADNYGNREFYKWKDDSTYHYFRYEPVKWRVLKTDGSKAMLLSDIVLDDRQYDRQNVKPYRDKDTTWEKCTIRSWLNGYGAGSNKMGISYSRNNFIDSAFTSKEKSAIADTKVVNNNNPETGAKGGKNTVDKLFLLSVSEVSTSKAETYGFISSNYTDEAKMCKSSDYAKAMGVYTNTGDYNGEWECKGNCTWWLRSPAFVSYKAATVRDDSIVDNAGVYVTGYPGVRVALNLNLSSSGLYSYAGTVSTKSPQTLKVTKSYTKTYGSKPFRLDARLTKGNGTLKYTTSDKKVATVSNRGQVTVKGTGICTITITSSATATYKPASAKVTITVKPEKNAVTKLKASGSRTLNVTWKKDTKGSGYELQYSASKSFPKNTTVTENISKSKTTSYRIKGLTKGKKYYIRIRTYKNIKVNGKPKKLYGVWSAAGQSGRIK